MLVNCKNEDDSIKNEGARVVTTVFQIYVYGDFYFRRSWVANSAVLIPSWSNFELVRDFMDALVTCKNKEDPIKNESATASQDFHHYKPMGVICCHGNQSSGPIWPTT